MIVDLVLDGLLLLNDVWQMFLIELVLIRLGNIVLQIQLNV